ncbi:MAG TPA: hypothetical protein VNJ01_07715 [Bacteriovoracaceae bacterium]|nr:hypothetical protein [Bacteriovoracaceae bacterium]
MKTLSMTVGLLTLSLVTGAVAQTTETTTTTYDSTVTRPVESGTSATPVPASESMMEQSSLYEEGDSLEKQRMEDRMEERSTRNPNVESPKDMTEDGIDYSDRKRTNRERKAVDTSSDASDDE